MDISCIKKSDVSFGYKNKLKTLWKEGKLPTVIKGFYGDTLTISTVSLEHLKPKSKGGASNITNYVLASVAKNQQRGNQDLKDFIDLTFAKNYLLQFKNLKTKGFNGDYYIKTILKTLKDLGIDLAL